MKLLVTGASGMLGRELVECGLAAGYEVVGCAYRREPAGAIAHQFDIRDSAELSRVFGSERPDAVIHTAYVQYGPDARSTIVEGTRNVATSACEVSARLIHISTDLVFDGRSARPYQEEDIPLPSLPYGRSKLEAEQIVAAAAPGALIVRPSLLYGGRIRARHEQLARDAAAEGLGTIFFEDEIRSPIAVADLAAALLELAVGDDSGLLHVGGPEAVNRYQLARAIVEADGGDPDRLRPGLAAERSPDRPRNCALDSSRARERLRSRIRTVDEVLSEARTREQE